MKFSSLLPKWMRPRAMFDGARDRRRLSQWSPSRNTLNVLLAQGGDMLRARTRDIHRNNPYAAAAGESYTANLIGCGIKPASLVENPELRKEIKRVWNLWVDECDADGVADFYGLQSIIARALFDTGEIFARFRPRKSSDGLTVPLQIQLLESDMLPYWDNRQAPQSQNTIMNGVEFDALGRRVAYWFYRVHPGDAIIEPTGDSRMQVRVPASEVVHIYKPLRAGQVRGVPILAPAVVKLWMLDQYDDAELDRKKTAAMYAGFVTTDLGEDFMPDAKDDPNGDDVLVAPLEPGTMQVLKPGESVEFSSPADVGGSYEMFQYRQLTSAFAAMGVPYVLGTGDLRRANYSSLRGALVEFRRKIEQTQHLVIAFQFGSPVWKRWMSDAVLSGALDIRDFVKNRGVYVSARWIAPKFDWVDPMKDRQAEKLAVDAGFKSRSDVVEAEGYDPEENDARIVADHEREKELGLFFPVKQAATTQPGDPNAPTADDIANAVNDQGGPQARTDKKIGAFNEDQERDERGRWTDGGGGDDTGGDGGNTGGGGGKGGGSKGGGEGGSSEPSGGTGYEFVSPNVSSGMTFTDAVGALSSPQQRALRDAQLYINAALGLHGRETDIVGAWTDGAENSVMSTIEHASWDKLALSASMIGALADQKAVALFHAGNGQDAILYSFEAKGDLETIHKDMLAAGLDNHSLKPTSGGAVVYVVDYDLSKADAAERGAEKYGAKLTADFGKSDLVGNASGDGADDREQRDIARKIYEANIRQSPVVGAGELWNRVRDRWGQGLTSSTSTEKKAEGAHRGALSFRGEFDPDQPRDEDGKWTGDGGSSGKGGEPDSSGGVTPAAPPAEPILNPEVVEVGGDEWNKSTARRLEREYEIAKPALDKLAGEIVNKDVSVPAPSDDVDEDAPVSLSDISDWDSVPSDIQEQAAQAWHDKNLDDFFKSEISNWQENGDAYGDAADTAAYNFNKGDAEWATDALTEYLGERREEGLPQIPFTVEGLIAGIELKFDTGWGTSSLTDKNSTVEFHDDKLIPEGWVDEPSLPGIEPEKPSDRLTDDMREDIEKVIREAWHKEAEKTASDMEPPEYLKESAEESVGSYWDEQSDKDKLKWTKDNTSLLDEEGATSSGSTSTSGVVTLDQLPSKFDPLEEGGSDADYKRTQAFARAASIERAADLIQKRGGEKDYSREFLVSELKRHDGDLWQQWKGSSTSPNGKLLQVATAEELGGRLNKKTKDTIDETEIKTWANTKFATIGGYEGVKAYIRAKWETTQYMLDKAGTHTLKVYRSVDVPREKSAEKIEKVGDRYEKLPDVSIVRNGAASTTLKSEVANEWDGDEHRIVLRAEVPRTAVISVPAYGINVHSEKEVVVAGTAWHAWDAWRGKAPMFHDYPVARAA